MQKMFPLFLRRWIANTMPQDMAAGRAGGTATVIMSSPLIMSAFSGTPEFSWNGIVRKFPKIATNAIMPTNFMLSI